MDPIDLDWTELELIESDQMELDWIESEWIGLSEFRPVPFRTMPAVLYNVSDFGILPIIRDV